MRAKFYTLNFEDNNKEEFFLCELIESLYEQKKTVLVLCNSQNQAEELDEALWQFREESFIPHNLEGEGPTPLPPVHLVYENFPKERFNTLLNLTCHLPDKVKQYEEIIMFVPKEEELKQKLRECYKTLQQAGFNVSHSTLP